jgi:hypothetical protein
MLLAVTGIAAALVSIEQPAERGAFDSSGHRVPVQRMPLQHHPMQLHRKLNDSAYTSTNWAGYAVTGAPGSVTDVKASWIVPAVDCTKTSGDGPNVYASFWTGIDGWASNTVEQIGTDSDCETPQGVANVATYYAWFEFYPAGAYYIGNPNSTPPFQNNTVTAGDYMTAEVSSSGSCSLGPRHHGGGEEFTAVITDVTQKWTAQTSSCMNAQQTSAEWITETPYGCKTRSGYCYLPSFVPAEFGQNYQPASDTSNFSASYVTVSGVTGSVGGPAGSFTNTLQQSIMVNANAPITNIPWSDVMAYPSPSCTSSTLTTGNQGILTACQEPTVITDIGGVSGTSFVVKWGNPGP